MPESGQFDPVGSLLGRFLSACVTVLAGAVALTVAVRLIAAVWVWLAIIAGVVVFLGVAVMLVTWWQRRRPW